MRDLVFLLLAVGFFVLAFLLVRACELFVGEAPALEEQPKR
jgi:hypothetical protein